MVGAYVSSLAFYVTALGTLLSDVVPQFTSVPLYSIAGATVHLSVLVVGVAMAVLVCAVNSYGMRAGAGTQLALLAGMVLYAVTRNRLGTEEALRTLLGEHHPAVRTPEAARQQRPPSRWSTTDRRDGVIALRVRRPREGKPYAVRYLL